MMKRPKRINPQLPKGRWEEYADHLESQLKEAEKKAEASERQRQHTLANFPPDAKKMDEKIQRLEKRLEQEATDAFNYHEELVKLRPQIQRLEELAKELYEAHDPKPVLSEQELSLLTPNEEKPPTDDDMPDIIESDWS